MHAMDLPWDDLRTVMLLVRHGTLAGAADALNVNYTTVARRVRRAEKTLGQPLFERLAEGYRPTETAKLMAEHAYKMENTEHSMMRKLQGQDTELSGTLTITAPQLMIAHFLSPVIDQFMTANPKIDLRILATNALLDLSRREADLAIRVSRNPGDTYKGLRLLRQDHASFGTQDWADRIQSDPTQMIDWINYDRYIKTPKNIAPSYPNNRVRLRLDDMVAMAGAAQAGLGVVRMPMFLGRNIDGLVQIPVLPPQPYLDLWVVAHPDVWPSAKVRAFLDPLISFCKSHRDLFVA